MIPLRYRRVLPFAKPVLDDGSFRPLTDAGCAERVAAHVAQYEACQITAGAMLAAVWQELCESNSLGEYVSAPQPLPIDEMRRHEARAMREALAETMLWPGETSTDAVLRRMGERRA